MNMQAMTMKQALKIQADGNTAVYNELLYGSYKANRNYGMTHAQAVKLGLDNIKIHKPNILK